MKDQFIEQDGKLFLECEPEPLELDSKMPCLAQPIQDDSRMGKINRISFKNNLERFVIHDMVNYISDGYYLRFEIIAKHCSEGSSEWALWQMLNGKKVKHERDATNYYYMDKNGMLVSKGEQIIEDESRWLKTSSRNGWKIYEEPKPKPEVGKWYQDIDFHQYLFCEQVFKNYTRFRQCGGYIRHYVDEERYDGLEPVSIEPDFSNAKVGDNVYSVAQGYTEVDSIEYDEVNNMVIVMVIKYSSCANDNEECYKDGRRKYDAHPTYFYSAAQCAAYFAEVARKEREAQ